MTLLLSSVSAGAIQAVLGPSLDKARSYVVHGTPYDSVNLKRSETCIVIGTRLDTVDLRGSKTYVILE
jgi:hypothetical protein